MTSTPPSTSALLAQAEAALHAVLTGRQSVEVVQEGKGMVKYGPANINQLRAYVAYLRGGEIKTVRISSHKGLHDR
jgi:hypothetical protein